MNNFLSPDSKFGRIFYKAGYLIILSWLWLIFSIPIFTIGASSVALYDIVRKVLADKEAKVISSYFQSFKENFKQATVLWLIMMVVLGVVIYSVLLFVMVVQDSSTLGALVKIVFYIVVVCVFIWNHVVFSYIARFVDTNVTAAKNTFMMCLLNPKIVLWIGALMAGVVALIITIPIMQYLPLVVSLTPSCYCALLVRPTEKLFEPYIPKEDEDEEH